MQYLYLCLYLYLYLYISISIYQHICQRMRWSSSPPTEQQLWFWPFAKRCIVLSPVNVYMSVYTYTFIWTCIHMMYTHAHIYIYICICICIHIYIYVYIYIRICIHIHIYIYVYAYIAWSDLVELSWLTPGSIRYCFEYFARYFSL